MSKRGWLVTFAGMGLNLALGVLYAWSVFGKQFTESVDKGGFGWSKTQAALPYTIAIAFFAVMMVPAGRLQDKFGPRVVASMGALLTGTGLIVTSFANSQNILPALIGFGAIAGMGIGLGYSTATPAAVKWFSADKKGLITGIVVSGFGLAPVYIAPLSKHLLTAYGINNSFMILGIGFTILTLVLAQFIRNPHSTHTPASPAKQQNAKSAKGVNYTWREMLRTPNFYILYVVYACAATAGLMIIGHLAKIVSLQSGNTIQIGFLFVALLAVFNAGGRIIAGFVSDYIGRIMTIALVCVAQAVIMFFFDQLSTVMTFFVGSAFVGFNYGACLALFPAATADYWGTKNFGLNYGILFTSWGIGGVFGPILAGKIADIYGSYTMAYNISAGLLMFGALLSALIYTNIFSKLSRKSQNSS